MIRFVVATRTTVLVLAWLIGVPVLLTATTGPPLPDRWPTSTQLALWLREPLTPAYGALYARSVAWLFWAVAAAATLTAVTTSVRRLRLPRIAAYLPAPMQGLAATVLGAAAVTSAAAPAMHTPAPAAATDTLLPPAASTTPNSATPSSVPHTTTPAETSAPTSADTSPPAAPMGVGGTHTALPRFTLAARTGPLTVTTTAAQYTLNAQRGHTSPRTFAPAAATTCRVVRGDTLWDLADTHLGDPHRWPEIYHLNHGHIQANGYALDDPDEIDIGWVLTLPARHPDHRVDPPATGPTVPQAPLTPQPSPPASPRTPQQPPSTDPSPTASATRHNDSGDDTDTPPSPSPRSTAPSSAATWPSGPARPSLPGSGSASPDADDGEQAPSPGPLDGVDLPGGWITLGLGGGLLAAAAMVRRRRRHHYQPTPITRPRLDEPDLLPPLAAMTRIRTGIRRSGPDPSEHQPAPAPTVRDYQAAVVKPVLPPVGPRGADLAGTAALPLSNGLGLTGDGALDAARGLLVATLASGSHDDPDAKGRAIIPAATLTRLLGAPAAALGHLDRLTVTASHADAITRMEEEIIRRSRLTADAHAADVRILRDTDVHAEPLPQLLLITERPDPAWTNRLATTVRLGHAADISAVVIGDWPPGTTLTVASDGTTGNDTPRLSVLDTATATDMLGLLREAHGPSDTPASPEKPSTPATENTEPALPSGPQTAERVAAPAATPTAVPVPEGDRLPVTVRVLGRPAVLDANGQPSPGIRSKAVELMVYLAVNRQGADLSDIMEALYPDANMRRATERLSTVVADLRKHIRRAAATPTDTTESLRQRLEPVPNTGSRYHLDPTIVAVDWWTVLDQYEAVATTTDTSRQLTHLTAALAAAGGPLADGVEYDWIDTDREVVRRHRIKLHVHAAALLADTDPHQSWLLLEQACQIDPLSDDLARTTMRAAAALGDADAIRHRLKTLREALDTHGLDMADDTQALAQGLLHRLHPPKTSA